MVTLIFSVLVAAYLAFFATQNALPVTLRFAGFSLTGVPLYAVVIGTLLIGLFLAWIISLFESLGATLTLHNKDKNLVGANQTINRLQEKVHNLEIENAKLHGDVRVGEERTNEVQRDRDDIAASIRHPFLQNLRHSFR